MVRGDNVEEKLSREGHRERMRKSFLAGNAETLPDHNLLELFLSIIIPRKDVKQLSYDLINDFGSLENVMNAAPEDLMAIDGIGESTAVAIACVRMIYKRIEKNRNNNVRKINSTKQAMEFCENELCMEKIEKVLLITLANDGTVLNSYIVSEGSVNMSEVNTKRILACVLKDNAASIILAHNHPGASACPSASDIDLTISIKHTLKTLNLELLDHIIVGSDSTSSIFQYINL